MSLRHKRPADTSDDEGPPRKKGGAAAAPVPEPSPGVSILTTECYVLFAVLWSKRRVIHLVSGPGAGHHDPWILPRPTRETWILPRDEHPASLRLTEHGFPADAESLAYVRMFVAEFVVAREFISTYPRTPTVQRLTLSEVVERPLPSITDRITRSIVNKTKTDLLALVTERNQRYTNARAYRLATTGSTIR
jgi:hypothetical protein